MARDTKQNLVDAGSQLFLERGYNETGLNDILAAAGVPKGSFYHHFRSKEDFALEVVDQYGHGGQAHIVGLSLGGYIALHLLAQKPERLLDVVVSGVPSRPIPHRWLMRIMGSLVAPFIHSDWLIRASAKSLHVPREDLPQYVARTKRNSKQAFAPCRKTMLCSRSA